MKEPTLQPSNRRGWMKAILLIVVLILAALGYFQFGESLTLESIAGRESQLRDYRETQPFLVHGLAFFTYVAVTALSFPGAAAMTLVFGWFFGFLRGVVLVSFASTAGATLSFLLSRYIFRDAVQSRFGKRLEAFNSALKRDGAFYLFTLRLIPAIPFFVINLVMGLTPIRLRTFWWVSQLGMIPGTMVYIYAGSTVPDLQSLKNQGAGGIMSLELILAFVALGVFPIFLKLVMNRLRPDLAARAAESKSDVANVTEGGTANGEAFGCVELYAGNEWAHRHVEMPGLEGDVIALPSEGREGGDLYALFSCGGARIARIVLADAVGHGFSAGQIAARLHRLLHEFRDIRDPGALLAALNDTFLSDQKPEAPSRLTTVGTANYNCDTGEFSYAYAGHPRMLLWRARSAEWCPLGKDVDGGLPLGVRALEVYSQQSVWLEPGDMVMAFSDATSEAEAPDGAQLTVKGFQQLADSITSRLPHPMSLQDQSKQLIEGISHHHHSDKFEDDLTLLTIRRSSSQSRTGT